jgi:hypothetical protein
MRRTRYNFIATNPRGDNGPIDVLAYSAPGAVRVLYGHGYTDIEPVAKPRKAKPHARAQWVKDEQAIAEVIDFLGIKLPVVIKQTGHQGGRHGAHIFRASSGKFMRNPAHDTATGGMYHHITVKSWLSPKGAGETIWHELCHAMQAERESAHATTMREQFDAWSTCSARGGTYDRRPVEVEARSYEHFNDEKPLAR